MEMDLSPTPDLHGPLLDLRAGDYDHSGLWRNRAAEWAPGRPQAAVVPPGVEFDNTERAFVFASGGDVVTAPVASHPPAQPSVSFAMWVKCVEELSNLAWLMSQGPAPDFGWSRALTLNDYRLGYISMTVGRYWDSGLGRPPLGQWFHVAGVWHEDGTAIPYLNGIPGEQTIIGQDRNIFPHQVDEFLCIGGRGPRDGAHNATVKVSDVCAFGRALSSEEVLQLYQAGHSVQNTNSPVRSIFGVDEVPDVNMLTPRNAKPLPMEEQPSPPSPLLPPSEKEAWQPRKRGLTDADPDWDEKMGLFWCNTGVSAYDIPDGDEWAGQFQARIMESHASMRGEHSGRPRQHRGDSPEPTGPTSPTARQRRKLVRFPSDEDKRTARALHTDALLHMRQAPGIQATVLGVPLALFRFGGRVFATDVACPHQGANLCEGEVGDMEDMVLGRRYYVRCKVHKFQFDLTTGAVAEGRCSALRTYAARIGGGAGSLDVNVQVGLKSLGKAFFDVSAVEDF